MVRQLVEKAFEHQMKQYLIFVDLHKAVPREAMWIALRKLGVPDLLVDIIRSFTQAWRPESEWTGSCWRR